MRFLATLQMATATLALSARGEKDKDGLKRRALPRLPVSRGRRR
jgi:hypothetical protein